MDEKKKISRKDFFKFGFRKGKEEVVKTIQKKIPRIGIRPPGALPEEEFLALCSRCDDCVSACPHDSIFKPNFSSALAYGDTPFLDLKNKACEYCDDMPCITSCTTGALVNKPEYMRIGIAKFNEDHCLVAQGQYCDYCAKSCPSEFDALSMGDNKMPVIDDVKCVGCGKCEYICTSQSGKALEVHWFNNT